MLILPPSSPERQCRSSCISLWTRSRRWGFSTCPAAPWPARSRRSAGDILKVEIRWHSQSWDQVTLSKLRSQSRPENFLSWQWKFSRVKFSLVRFQQIESRWGYSGTSDKIRLINYISWPLGCLYFYSQIYCGSEDLRCRLWSLWLYSWTLRVSDTENINCWQFLLAGMT